jgi:hypothetical protein
MQVCLSCHAAFSGTSCAHYCYSNPKHHQSSGNPAAPALLLLVSPQAGMMVQHAISQ